MATEYVKDDAGQCFIPSTQRPDGSWRKPRRVKEGYVPQDEVPLYESKGKQWAKNKSDYPIGLAPDDVRKLKEDGEEKKTHIPGLTPEMPPALSSKNKKKKKVKSKSDDISNAVNALKISEESKLNANIEPQSAEPLKRLRNLKKKLTSTEKLEQQIKNGELKAPDADQLEKVKRKPELLKEIKELSKLV